MNILRNITLTDILENNYVYKKFTLGFAFMKPVALVKVSFFLYNKINNYKMI